MSDLSNKVSYLKGLADGMRISEKSDEGKLIAQLIEALSDTAKELAGLSSHCDTIDEAVDRLRDENVDINMSLDELFDYNNAQDSISFGDDEDEAYYEDDDDDLFEPYEDSDEDGLFEIMCPECGEDVIVDFDMLDDDSNIVCPNCHHDIELEFDVEDDDEADEVDE